jgi:hypothetical protein
MPVYDFRDRGTKERLANNLGESIGTIISKNKQRKQAEAAKEQKRVNEQMTLHVMRGEGTAEEKLHRMLAQTEFVRRMRQKQFEDELFARQGKTDSQLLTEFKKVNDVIERTISADPITGEQTVLPGFEVVNAGAKKRLKELTLQLFGDVQVEKEPETIGEFIEQKRKEREATGTQLPSEIKDKPTPEELRAQGTREAYEKGKELGYWE